MRGTAMVRVSGEQMRVNHASSLMRFGPDITFYSIKAP